MISIWRCRNLIYSLQCGMGTRFRKKSIFCPLGWTKYIRPPSTLGRHQSKPTMCIASVHSYGVSSCAKFKYSSNPRIWTHFWPIITLIQIVSSWSQPFVCNRHIEQILKIQISKNFLKTIVIHIDNFHWLRWWIVRVVHVELANFCLRNNK